MGSQVSQPVTVEQVRSGLFCVRWRMTDSVYDFRCYANTFKLRSRRPSSYSITAMWINKKYTIIIEAGLGGVPKSSQDADKIFSVCEKELDTNNRTGNRREQNCELPQSVWISYGGGHNQQLHESSAGTWKIDDFQFSTVTGQRLVAYRTMRPWSGTGLTFRLWLDFQATTLGERTTLKQLGDAFTQQTNCDVCFQVGDETIGAHMAVLSARSPVFAAMFQHDMREARTRQVGILDIDFPVFKQLLLYLYTGRAPELRLDDEMAQQLLLAADKYDIQDLKDECQSLLHSRITTENAVETLIWAHYHSISRLAEAALNFVAQHDQEDVQSNLEELSKNCPELSHLVAMKRMMINQPSLCSC